MQNYTTDQKTEKKGLAASLSLSGNNQMLIVGVGSTFFLDEKKYEIIDVVDTDPFGKITIKLLP